MENQKNLFLAIAISMAIIFGFQFLMPPEAPVENTTTNKMSIQVSILFQIQSQL